MRASLCALILTLYCAGGFAKDMAQYLTSSKKANVYAGKLVQDGDFESAKLFLLKAVRQYPRDERLFFLLGQAYYESRELKQSESYFMEAIRLNPLNTHARAYVTTIREINEASESEQARQLREVFLDKLGDVVVFALGFMMGSSLSGLISRFNVWRFARKSRKTFLSGNYDDFADLLETQIFSNELQPLRESLAFMFEQKGLAVSKKILEDHVNSHSNLSTLIRMLELNARLNS